MELLILLLPRHVPTFLFLVIVNHLSKFSNWNMEVCFDSSLYLILQNPNFEAIVVESISSINTICIYFCPSFCHSHPQYHHLSLELWNSIWSHFSHLCYYPVSNSEVNWYHTEKRISASYHGSYGPIRHSSLPHGTPLSFSEKLKFSPIPES